MPNQTQPFVCVFDAYGTLFDVNAAARRAAEGPDGARLKEVWPEVARDWRMKQLQYTWLRAVAGRHCDFWKVTQDGLDWALEAAGLDDPALRQRLLDLYLELDTYPGVPDVLSTLKAAGHKTAILSNGSPDMLAAAVTSAGLTDKLDSVLSVEEAGIFKPHDRVYDLVIDQFGGPKHKVLFVSSNGWDAAGAAGYGFRTVWVNRAGDPVDRLYAEPHHILPDLTSLPEVV
ncbi:haloacid dehalogenase type II [Ponticoccus sp. SC2-23]|uniref:haloacid dehalogenase type II n=1 Tax=Alexandriicola marinus TaxID=2081710 RepID=UPI000FD8C5A1|nr:haloacid dehalogenase type II [Alexandriicola marinus]MBM1222212.1 haloacid dehalogenase type II [Ponticoccus sp. SC6-9]MBM1226899.1 haloacid dehalogenase type II [Ponticoccus sp. SC6-15]MBM1231159.1 haloacid dehalogenase type II [Ponticoccus sp. SC6-38]MBM1235589.1 haloacid dehalogenase type II [Ponticoccus sp. SC6-45]MBM1240181.1 haloacid dehalogenase type II [Ponticoccus sp. SC6-49]MBM1244535.1 haloacid dehalogenase type II [Ponticoccus sp. SC2-64]MBM1249063.1 haloacid dehalogenase typ